jgi:hypothetical protein
MAKIVSLLKPGVSGGDVNGVRFNAVTVADNEQTETTFVLGIDDAKRLGRELSKWADKIHDEERKAQEETIRRIEESR